MRKFTVKLDNNALKAIEERNIRGLFIRVNYRKGPCTDNMCKLIPVPEVVESTPESNGRFTILDNPLIIEVAEPLYRALLRFGGEITISYSSVRRKFIAKGIPYNL